MNNFNEFIPEGLYVCNTLDVTNGMTKDGYKTILWKIQIIEGDLSERIIHKWYTLRSKHSERFMEKELVSLGIYKREGPELHKSDVFGKYFYVQARRELGRLPSFYIKGLVRPVRENRYDNGMILV